MWHNLVTTILLVPCIHIIRHVQGKEYIGTHNVVICFTSIMQIGFHVFIYNKLIYI
jgi:hypothetical protein